MKEYRFRLDIPRVEALRYYAGTAQAVQVTDDHGRIVRFPASALRPFVTEAGIQGLFLLRTERGNKLVELKRIASGPPPRP